MKILTYPNALLFEECQIVDPNVINETKKMLHRFMLTHKNAAGITANQLGSLADICACRIKGKIRFFSQLNLDSNNKGRIKHYEECLSAPGLKILVERFEKVNVSYYDLQKNKIVLETYEPPESYILQHEIDHLNGEPRHMIYLNNQKKEKKTFA